MRRRINLNSIRAIVLAGILVGTALPRAVDGAAEASSSATRGTSVEFTATKTDALMVDGAPLGVANPGDTIRYSVVLTNVSNLTAGSGFVDFDDVIGPGLSLVVGSVTSTPPGMVVTGNMTGDTDVGVTIGPMMFGGMVTITFDVAIDNPFPMGPLQVSNQGTVRIADFPIIAGETPPAQTRGLNEFFLSTDDPDTMGITVDPTVTAIVVPPPFTALKTDVITTDLNNDGIANPGDTLGYEVVLTNFGETFAVGGLVQFLDFVDANTTLVAGSVATTKGLITFGNGLFDSIVFIDVGTMALGEVQTISFRATINTPAVMGLTQVSNQGTVSITPTAMETIGSAVLRGGTTSLMTDDPDTTTLDDATVTPVVVPPPAFTVTKTDTLTVDTGLMGEVDPIDEIKYTVVVSNITTSTQTNVVFADFPDAFTTLIAGSVMTSQGTVTTGNTVGGVGSETTDTSVEVAIGSLAPGGTATIMFTVIVDNLPDQRPGGGTPVIIPAFICNQGSVTSAEFPAPTPSDDPDVTGEFDETCTPVNAEIEGQVSITKTAAFTIDAGLDGVADPGDEIEYTVVISSNSPTPFGAGSVTLNRPPPFTGAGPVPANLAFRDTPGANTTLIVGSVQASTGRIDAGNTMGDTSLAIVNVAPRLGLPTIIRFRVTVDDPITGTPSAICNQGELTNFAEIFTILLSPNVLFDSGFGMLSIPTDDPGAEGTTDPTCVSVNFDPGFVPPPVLVATKTDELLVDGDNDGFVDAGDTIKYTVTISNDSFGTSTMTLFNDAPSSLTTLVAGSVMTSQGTITSGNTAGDTVVGVDIGLIGDSRETGIVTIMFNVTVNGPIPDGVLNVYNQGFVTSSDLGPMVEETGIFSRVGATFIPTIIPTDDPDTQVTLDSTCTRLDVPAPGPNLPPDALDDEGETNEDEPLDLITPLVRPPGSFGVPLGSPIGTNLLDNDTDPDVDPLKVFAHDAMTALGVEVSVTQNGRYVYDPRGVPGIQGLAQAEMVGDSFDYSITDDRTGNDTATVNLKVFGRNDAPTARDDLFIANEDTLLVVPAPGVLNHAGIPDTDADVNDRIRVGTSGLYGSSSAGEIFRIDLQTGVGRLFGQLGIRTNDIEADPTAGGHTPLAFAQEANGANQLHRLDLFGPRTGLFLDDGHDFASLEFIGGDIFAATSTDLWMIATADAASMTRAVPIATTTLIGATGVGAPLSGLAYDTVNNILYGVSGSVGASSLYTVDTMTGAATFVRNIGFEAGSLQFGPDGNLYAGGTASVLEGGVLETRFIALDNGGDILRVDLAGTSDTLVGATGFDTITGLTTLIGPAFESPSQVFNLPIVGSADGAFTFDPTMIPNVNALAVGESLIDRFVYTISDDFGATDTATASIMIMGVNDNPTPNPDAGATDEDTVLVVSTFMPPISRPLPINQGLLINDTDPDKSDMLHVSAFDAFSMLGAAVNVNSDGTYTYDPTGAPALQALRPGEAIVDRFDYTANDGNGGTAMATVSVTVSGINDPPMPMDDEGQTDEDTTFALAAPGVLINDKDADTSASLHVSDFQMVSDLGADVIIGMDGAVDYDPTVSMTLNALSVGTSALDAFTYSIEDEYGATGTATFRMTVDGVNDQPTATNDNGQTDEDTILIADAVPMGLGGGPRIAALNRNVLVNDSDPDANDMLSVTGFDAVSLFGAVVTVAANGAYTYDPTGAPDLQEISVGTSLTDRFDYTIGDGNGGSDTATVFIEVVGVNDPPVAVADSDATDEDTAIWVDAPGVLANDFDIDLGDTVRVLSGGLYGSNANGELFVIDLETGEGTFVALLPGFLPSGLDGAANGLNIIAFGATEIETDPLTLDSFVQGRNGTFVIQRYAPFSGDPIGRPVADGLAFNGLEFVGGVLYGAAVPGSGLPSTLRILDPLVGYSTEIGLTGFGPISGLAINGDMDIMYGIEGGPGPANLLTIDLDTGVATIVGNTGIRAGSLQFGPDGNLYAGGTGRLGGNRQELASGLTDGETLDGANTSSTPGSIANGGEPSTGNPGELWRIDPATGAATFVGDTGFGSVTGLTLVPGGGFQNPSDLGAEVEVDIDGEVHYDPTVSDTINALAQDECTTDTFYYTVVDNFGATAMGTVSIKLTGVNDAPTAIDDSGETNEDTLLTGSTKTLGGAKRGTTGADNVLDNDVDPDNNDVIMVVAFDAVSRLGASVMVDPDGTYTYDPTVSTTLQSLAIGESAVDQFDYTIEDILGATSTATVFITVTGVNDPPVAVDDTGATDEDSVLEVPALGVLANDTDPDTSDLDDLRVTEADAFSRLGARVSVDSFGALHYDPTRSAVLQALAMGRSIVDTFDYTMTDRNGEFDSATVFITVTGVNDAPVAVDDDGTTFEGDLLVVEAGPGTPRGRALLNNDSDVDTGDGITVVLAETDSTSVMGASVGVNADGSYAYDPTASDTLRMLNSGEKALDMFNYTIVDMYGAKALGTAFILVLGNSANRDAITANEDVPLNVGAPGVLGNDNLAEVVDVAFGDTTSAKGASVMVNSDGSYTYDPTGSQTLQDIGEGDSMLDTFTYTVNLMDGNRATATVGVTVMGENDAPREIRLDSRTIEELRDPGTLVGNLRATDDTGDVHTYSLVPGEGDTDNASFAILFDQLETAVMLDRAEGTTRTVRLQVEDQGMLTFEQAVQINVHRQRINSVATPWRLYE